MNPLYADDPPNALADWLLRVAEFVKEIDELPFEVTVRVDFGSQVFPGIGLAPEDEQHLARLRAERSTGEPRA